jgi:hypothetical protein
MGIRHFLDAITSLRLTIICLAAAMILVFVGTLAQVKLGTHIAQEKYFQSLFVWWQSSVNGIRFPVLPGGHLIGGVLLVNLVAAHIRRFRWGWNKFGIHLIHGGLILMLAGGLLTDLFQVESAMTLDEGSTKNYSENQRLTELVVVDTSDPELNTVTAIPEARLRNGGIVDHPSLPFTIRIDQFYQNSRLTMLKDAGSDAKPAAPQGIGSQVAIVEVPRATAMNERDLVSARLTFLDRRSGEPLGTWLASNALGAPQKLKYDGKNYEFSIRQERYYEPYSITLHDFTHERYPGTEIPKDFSSRITLIDPETGENREVLIYMNHPLRYRGTTFFQAGFDNNDTTSILQVVKNPSYQLPYISCVVVGLGLIWQFSYHLVGFARKRRKSLA